MFERKSVKAICMPLLLSGLTLLTGGILCFFCGNAQKYIPPVAAFYTNVENQLMKSDLPADVCAYAPRISTAQKRAGGEAVRGEEILTAGNWAQVLEPQMATGQFYAAHEIEEEKSLVVISEKLATQLFFTTDVVGQTLLLGQKEYTIIGVIKEQGGALAPFCGQGLPRFYRQATKDDPVAAQGVFAKGLGGISAAQFRSFFSETMEQGLPEGYFENYAVTRQLLKTCSKTACFLLVICMLFWAEYLGKGCFKNRCARFTNGFALLVKGIRWGVCLLGARTVILSMPTSILPPDRIFNMRHYIQIAAKAKQSEVLYHITFSLHFAASLRLQTALLLLSVTILLFLLTWASIKIAWKACDP